jgi:hypothetical protein
MSCAAPIEPSKVEDSYYVADIATIGVDYQHKTNDQYGAVARAHLHVYGYVRRITSVMKEMINDPSGDAYRGMMQLDESRKYRRLYVDGQLSHDIGYGPGGLQQFGELPDWSRGFEPVEYYCLLLAVSLDGPQGARLLRGLLLEPTGEDSTFRRVGHIFFFGRCAMKVRYQLRSSDVDEDSAWQQLWEKVAPYWGELDKNTVKDPETTGLVHVDIQGQGPSSLYEFDGDLTDVAGCERLEASIITLV